MTDHALTATNAGSGEAAIARALTILVNASRVDPLIREAVLVVERELRRLDQLAGRPAAGESTDAIRYRLDAWNERPGAEGSVVIDEKWSEPCSSCDDTGIIPPHSGRGSDGPEPCPDCVVPVVDASPEAQQ